MRAAALPGIADIVIFVSLARIIVFVIVILVDNIDTVVLLFVPGQLDIIDTVVLLLAPGQSISAPADPLLHRGTQHGPAPLVAPPLLAQPAGA